MIQLMLRTGVLASAILATSPVLGQDMTVAGKTPATRPQGAPVITEFDKTAAWYSWALRGVEKPYPYSLKFLEDQGNWFNPFLKPGMTGPYDIRGWH